MADALASPTLMTLPYVSTAFVTAWSNRQESSACLAVL